MGKPEQTRLAQKYRLIHDSQVAEGTWETVNVTGSTWNVKHIMARDCQIEFHCTENSVFKVEPGEVLTIEGYIQVATIEWLTMVEDGADGYYYVTFRSGDETARQEG